MILDRCTRAASHLLIAAVFTGVTAIAADAQDASVATPESATSVLAVLQAVLSNPTDLEFVEQYTTDDFSYVSLNYGDPEVKRVLPWAGTTNGATGLVQAFIDVGRYWTVNHFEIEDTFENEDGAAMFGSFTYTSNTLGKTVTFPLRCSGSGEERQAVLCSVHGGHLRHRAQLPQQRRLSH